MTQYVYHITISWGVTYLLNSTFVGLKVRCLYHIKHFLISSREKWLESELLLKQQVNAVFIFVCLYHRVMMMMIVIVMVVAPPALGAALAVLYCREC